jgi:hypothetical protein
VKEGLFRQIVTIIDRNGPGTKEYKRKLGKKTGYMTKKKKLTCSIVVMLRSNNYHVTKSVSYCPSKNDITRLMAAISKSKIF